MSGFTDPTISQRLRDAVTKIAEGVVKEKGVTYRYGTVQSIDYVKSTVTVRFAGSTTDLPVKTLGVQPTATGQIVQVSGVRGDHFVSGVVGAASLGGAAPGTMGKPVLTLDPYTESIVATWSTVTNAAAYEIEFAEDPGFTANPVTFQISATQFIYNETDTTKTLYARVRALTYHDPPQAGPWSDIKGPVSTESQATVSTDGSPPADSPDVTVVSGIGYLQARWPAQANADPVTYEVHIATSSGFSPGPTTLYDETSGRTSFIRTTADGTALAYDTDYYVRVLAKDADGSAPNPGAQDIGRIDRVETGDAGNIGIGNISDGLVPSTSPDVGSVSGGIGYLFVTWDHVTNVDPVTYEIHLSTASGFAPDANSLIGDTPSNFHFIREQGASGVPLNHGVTYYIKIIAKDADGYAPDFGAQGQGAIVKAQTADLAVGSITAASGIIADAAIGTAKIQDAAITNLKVAEAAISNAKIANLAVDDAKISDLDVGKITAGSLTADVIVSTGELSAVGVGGEVLIDSSGIRAWSNTSRTGTPIFELKSADGSATFEGDITSGSTITGATVSAATITGGSISGAAITGGSITSNTTITGATITGGVIRTATSGDRIVIDTGANTNLINFYTGATTRGYVGVFSGSAVLRLWADNNYGLSLKANLATWDASTTSADMIMEVFPNTASNGGGRFWHDFSAKQWKFQIEGTNEMTLGTTGLVVPNVNADFAGGGDDTVLVDSSGQLHINTSSLRHKDNVRDLPADIPSILDLKPRAYEKNGVTQFGLIAEDIAPLWPDVATYEEDGRPRNYQDRGVLALMLKELREMDRRLKRVEVA